jgi:hypothetical protein
MFEPPRENLLESVQVIGGFGWSSSSFDHPVEAVAHVNEDYSR